MPDETDDTPRRQFTRDLRRIREDREVSIEEIHSRTQISTSQLKALEEGTLFDHSSMNRIYLRAFVRSYAEAVELPVQATLTHFEAAFEGRYEGELAEKFIDRPASSIERKSLSSKEEEEETHPDPASIDDEEESQHSDPSASSETTDEDESPRQEETASSASDEDPASVPSWMEEQAFETEPGEMGASIPSDSSKAPSSPPSESQSPALGDSSKQSRRDSPWLKAWHLISAHRGAILAALSVLILVAFLGGLGVFFFGDANSTVAEGGGTKEPVDAPALEASGPSDTTESTSAEKPLASITLGDTLYVTVLATTDIQEMRIRRDDDLRRPYWIEEQEATVFPFTRQITIENQVDSARIFLEGYPFPRSQVDSLGRIVIDRQTAQAFADTLRGSPPMISAQTDTAVILQPPSDEPID